MAKRRGGAKRQAYARDVREKKKMETVEGSHEEEGSGHLGAENGDPAEGGFADGRLRRHEGGNCFRKRRVRFAGEEESGGDEGGVSRDEAVVPCEEGEVAEGAVTCVPYRSAMNLRSTDGGGKKKVVYGDSEEDEGFAKKRMRRRKATSKGGVMEVHETGEKKKENGEGEGEGEENFG